jgi:Phage integrase, N-terminal SAM-like domain
VLTSVTASESPRAHARTKVTTYNNIAIFSTQPNGAHNKPYYCTASPTLIKHSTYAQESDIYPGCRLFIQGKNADDWGRDSRKKKGEGSPVMMGEDSLLERVTAAAEERQLSHNSLLAYRRTWLRIIAWAAAEGLVLETLPPERVGEFYEEATRGRSASHHLQVKAALSLLYHVLGSPNPFSYCQAPKFSPEKTELRYHTASQLGQLLCNCARIKGATLAA